MIGSARCYARLRGDPITLTLVRYAPSTSGRAPRGRLLPAKRERLFTGRSAGPPTASAIPTAPPAHPAGTTPLLQPRQDRRVGRAHQPRRLHRPPVAAPPSPRVRREIAVRQRRDAAGTPRPAEARPAPHPGPAARRRRPDIARQIQPAALGILLQVAQDVGQLQRPAEGLGHAVGRRRRVAEGAHRQPADRRGHAIAIEIQRRQVGRDDDGLGVHLHAVDDRKKSGWRRSKRRDRRDQHAGHRPVGLAAVQPGDAGAPGGQARTACPPVPRARRRCRPRSGRTRRSRTSRGGGQAAARACRDRTRCRRRARSPRRRAYPRARCRAGQRGSRGRNSQGGNEAGLTRRGSRGSAHRAEPERLHCEWKLSLRGAERRSNLLPDEPSYAR